MPRSIAALEVGVEPETLAAADDARAEISRFDAELSALLPGDRAGSPVGGAAADRVGVVVPRTEQVWIGGSSASPHGATFVPPQHPHITPAMDDLCAFIDRSDVPLLVQCAVAHAQFETIHPFNDGNGRVGRALVHAMLQHGGATTRATVPVSAGLLTNTGAYFAALTDYRAGDITPIVARFVDATFAAVGNGRQLAQELVEVHDAWSASLTARRTASVWRVLPLLLSQPVVTSALIQRVVGLSQPAADQVISRLRDAGILTKASGHQRYVAWVATDVTSALDDFADRARRRPSA